MSSKAETSFEPPPNSPGGQQMLAMVAMAYLVCLKETGAGGRAAAPKPGGGRDNKKGDRVAEARTAPEFLTVEAGDSGQLRPAGDTE